jgi:tetratricopeptide (TPR) repeat protein
MQFHDDTGHRLSGANADAAQAFRQACFELRCLVGDPLSSVERAIQHAPGMAMAHVLKAWLYLIGTEPGGIAPARAACTHAANLPADARERAHLAAALALCDGRWTEAGRLLEELSVEWPRDLLALQIGHQIDFFRGDTRMLRDRIARAVPVWDAGVPGYHALLGMHAFGLEETGDYDAAERAGMRAVQIEPHDAWAWHAVAHVHEMRADPQAGIGWLAPGQPTWSDGCFFAVHLHWHLALFHLDLDDHAAALKLYDAAIGGAGSALALDLVDASAMLWRMRLRGIDVGPRWNAISDRWIAAGEAGRYAFNDFHAMLAHVGAGRATPQATILDAQRALLAQGSDNAGYTRDVGYPACMALHAIANGDYRGALQALRGIRSHAHRFGGSHAQRDLIDLTMLDVAERAGERAWFGALVAERRLRRPRNPLVQRLAARAWREDHEAAGLTAVA